MLNREDKAKLKSAKELALEALIEAGDKGLDSLQLQRISGISATARLRELISEGHLIEKQRVSDNRLLWIYRYRGFNKSGQLLLFSQAA